MPSEIQQGLTSEKRLWINLEVRWMSQGNMTDSSTRKRIGNEMQIHFILNTHWMGISRHNWTSQGSDWRDSLEYGRAPWQCPRCASFLSEIFIPFRKHLLPQKIGVSLELPAQTLPKQSKAISRHTGSIFPAETLLKSQPHLATLNMENTALKQRWHNIQIPFSISQLPCGWVLMGSRGWLRTSHSLLPWWDALCAPHQCCHSPLYSLCEMHWKVTSKLKAWSTELSNFLY